MIAKVGKFKSLTLKFASNLSVAKTGINFKAKFCRAVKACGVKFNLVASGALCNEKCLLDGRDDGVKAKFGTLNLSLSPLPYALKTSFSEIFMLRYGLNLACVNLKTDINLCG